MSQYDNEIYRGQPETGPTLARGTCGADYYVVKPPQTTVEHDSPATKDTVWQEAKPTKKKNSRIGKAMKLLASCVTTVAVAATLAAPAPELPEWPRILPSTYGYTYDWISQNSVDCQVSNFYKSYRLTAQQEGIYLNWGSGVYTYFNVDVAMRMPTEDWDMYLYFDTDPTSIEDTKAEYSYMYSNFSPTFGTGQIQTVSGETLYVLGMMWRIRPEDEMPPVQQIIDHLDEYIQISDATADGWDKIIIGNTMYTETNLLWTGTVGIIDEFAWFELRAVSTTADASFSAEDLICRRSVNNIDWSFYYGDEVLGARVIWAVPAQEDIALGYNYIVGGDDLNWQEDWFNKQEWPSWVIEAYGGTVPETWQEVLAYIVDNVISKYILCHYHLLEPIPEQEPNDIPTDATEVPTADPTEDTIPAVTEEPTEPTEVPLTTEIETYNFSSGKEETIRYYDQNGEEVTTEYYRYTGNRLSWYDFSTIQDGYELKESRQYDDNERIAEQTLSDERNNVYKRELFLYYENGALREYTVYYYDSDYRLRADFPFEIYCERYDESGTVIDTDHRIQDPETRLWTIEDYDSYFYGAGPNAEWTLWRHCDGIFTTSSPYEYKHVFEGVYQEAYLEPGFIFYSVKKEANGSEESLMNYLDGSLEQLSVSTMDEVTNTWTEIVERHPNPSDDFAYHTESRVRFDGNGKVVEYYHNSDGDIIEINFDEANPAEMEYDENGRMISFHYVGDRFKTTVWFLYDQWGRFEDVASNTTWYW